jgi:hypothetical protein
MLTGDEDQASRVRPIELSATRASSGAALCEQPTWLGYSPSTANVLPSGSLNHATFPPPALGDMPRSSVVSPS